VGYLNIEEGRHPCLDLAGDALIPNDTQLSQEKSLIILTGDRFFKSRSRYCIKLERSLVLY
jgi:dsDNA-specific endonuclease/ATPase MutS2